MLMKYSPQSNMSKTTVASKCTCTRNRPVYIPLEQTVMVIIYHRGHSWAWQYEVVSIVTQPVIMKIPHLLKTTLLVLKMK